MLIYSLLLQVKSSHGLIFKVQPALRQLAEGLEGVEYIDSVEARTLAIENTPRAGALAVNCHDFCVTL